MIDTLGIWNARKVLRIDSEKKVAKSNLTVMILNYLRIEEDKTEAAYLYIEFITPSMTEAVYARSQLLGEGAFHLSKERRDVGKEASAPK